MTEREQFEEKKVFLWGLKQASKSLLKEFDKGNQNPKAKKSTKKAIKEEIKKEKPKEPRKFDLDENYSIDDLDFLNKEYERLDNEMANTNDVDVMDELGDLQEKLGDLIEGLEAMAKLGGKGLTRTKQTHSDNKVLELIQERKQGRGFKKGSPEAIEHAKKMREKLNKTKKTGEKKVDNSKIRVEKGTEQAKSVGQRLAEARKKKQELKKLEEEKKAKEEEEKKANIKPSEFSTKGKPYYYIGDIPKGYRPASMLEAIEHKKVSEYGKYVVDYTIYEKYRDYGILINPEPSDLELRMLMLVMKKKIMRELEDIEIYASKLDNPKYNDRKAEFEDKLDNAVDKKKVFSAIYNFYHKIWCERNNKQYKRITFKREVKEIDTSRYNSNTPKEITTKIMRNVDMSDEPKKEKIEQQKENIKQQKEYIFGLGDKTISLKDKYFDDDMTLKSVYALKLMQKGIILLQKYYKDKDVKKYFFSEIY
jgi:hypothetical protein